MGKDKKKKKKKKKRPPSDPDVQQKKDRSSHKSEKLNQWDEVKMARMLKFWNDTAKVANWSYRRMAKKFEIPYNTAR